MGRGALGCQGDCGAARLLHNSVMTKEKIKRDEERAERLAEALRANLRRRKEQARNARNAGQSDEKTSN